MTQLHRHTIFLLLVSQVGQAHEFKGTDRRILRMSSTRLCSDPGDGHAFNRGNHVGIMAPWG